MKIQIYEYIKPKKSSYYVSIICLLSPFTPNIIFKTRKKKHKSENFISEGLTWFVVFNATFKQYFSYIMAVSFIGGVIRST